MINNIQKTSSKWEVEKLGDICESLDNKRVPISKEKRESGLIPYYGATGIVDHVKDYIFDEKLLLVGEDGADWSSNANTSYLINGKSWVNNHAHVLRCTKINDIFLKEYLNYQDFSDLVGGSTRGKLTKGDLEKILVPFPPLDTQQKIATILFTIDDAIQKTDQIIKKTEKLKNGLLTELLVKGIGHKKFKKTKLGEIPEEWNVVQLSELSYITKLAGYEFTKYFNSYKDQGEIVIIRGLNLKNGELDLSNIKTIPKSVADNLQRSKLCSGDLVFSYVGTIGPVAIITENNKYHLGPNVCKISPNKYVSSNYLYQYFLSELIKKEINKKISVTAQPSLSMEKIRVFEIILPSNMDEQSKICEMLMVFDKKNRNYVATKEKLLVIKSGLMNDIFSQKVEVH